MRRIIACAAPTSCLLLLSPQAGLLAAELTVEDGVVVKFAPNGGLVIRDGVLVQGQVVFTSRNDDAHGGALGPAPGSPLPGDWLGVRFERSAPAALTQLGGLEILFAGNGGPACTLRDTQIPLGGFLVSKSASVGLLATASATSSLLNLVLTQNQIGFQAQAGSRVELQSSVIAENTGYGALNENVLNPIPATGIWWGHPSGPLDPSDDTSSGGLFNPNGLGNRVSDGIIYAPLASGIPLFGLSAIPIGGTLRTQRDVTFQLRAPTAVGVRLSEDPSFAGVAFQPLTPTRTFQLSQGDGPKTVYVAFQAATGNTASISTQLQLDSTGPTLNVTTPSPGAVLTRPVTVVATASDPSGVARVEFHVDNVLLSISTTNPYSFYWDVRTTGDGPRLLSVVAVDTIGARTRQDVNVTVAAAPPTAPVITSPVNGTVTSANEIPVSGTASPAVTITLLRSGGLAGRTLTSNAGDWTVPSVTLAEGTNAFSAVASDTVGSSPPSTTVTVVRDTGPPPPPASLVVTDLQGGTKRFDWIASDATDVASYTLYRSTSIFSSRAQASPVRTGITGLFTTDLPPSDGTFYYAITALDAINNESEISNVVQTSADRTAPSAILTASQTGVVGPGPVTLSLTVSEPISASPFLGATPQGGAPTAVELFPTPQPHVWQGTFTVLSSMPSGPVAFSFSARDLAGNRGTTLTSSPSLTLDTQGPLGTVTVTPSGPLGPRTSPQPVARLTLDEIPSATPVLRFVPPSGSPVTLNLSGAGISWQGDLFVTTPMGDGTGSFELDAIDQYGNQTSGPVPGPPVLIDNTAPVAPSGLAGQSLPAGHILLIWAAVTEATYTVYRAPSGQLPSPGDPPIAAGVSSPSFTDLPPSDGSYAYAISAVDLASNESALSAPATAVSDRVPPGDPADLQLAIEGNGIRASWSPHSENPATSFLLYRSTSPITTVSGLTPVQAGLSGPSALDRPPSDGTFYYAVVGLDAAANPSGPATAGPFTFDEGDPVITIGGVTDGLVTNQSVTITYSATDFSIQSVTATLDGEPFLSGGTVAQEGEHDLVVNASDTSGNTATETVNFSIDQQAPEVTVSGVDDGGHYDGPVTPTITVTDAHLASSTIRLNGSPFLSGTLIDSDGSYALHIHASDLAGNATDRTLNFFVDAPPPALASLNLDLPDAGFPILSWPALSQSDVVGYIVVRNNARLTPVPLTATAYTDSTFDPFSSHVYEVFAVDAAGHEGPSRRATLPLISISLGAYGTSQHLTRRYFDAIKVSVTNQGQTPIAAGLNALMTLKDAGIALATRTSSTTAALGPGATVLLGQDFPIGAGAAATRTLEVALTIPSGPGNAVRILRSYSLNVREPTASIDVFSDPIVRGGLAQIKLKIFNQGSARMQVKTSQSGGPSPDVEVFIKDLDGNVLGVGRLDQRGGGVIVTQSLAFAAIQGGSSFLTRAVPVQVPSTAPDQVLIEGVVHTTHTDLIGPTDTTGPELRGAVRTSTGTPPYLAIASTDRSVYQQQEIVQITGRAYDPATNVPVPNVPVKIGVSTRGFDRFLTTSTDGSGNFTTVFTPLATEAGSYNVWATHPLVMERSSQATFDILGLYLSPSSFNLRMSQNSSFPIGVNVRNTGETPLTGFTFNCTSGRGVTCVVDPASEFPELVPGQTARVGLTIHASIDADQANFSILVITTAEGMSRNFPVSIALLPAVPTIQTEPSYVQASTSNGGIYTANVRVRNLGYSALEGITLESPATPWITLGVGPALPPISVGNFVDVPVIVAPPAFLTPGVYSDRFIIRSSNHVAYTQNIFATVTSSTTGSARFEVRNTENSLLSGASVWIQNLQVPSLTFSRNTNTFGIADFSSLPSGPYQHRVQAPGVETTGGTFRVQPNQVTPVSLIMNAIYVTLEWSVTPIMIQDRYDFALTATFVTSVPAPVLVANPASFALELEDGAVFLGEYTLTNHGLVAADDLTITPNSGPGLAVETLVTSLPRLAAMASLEVPLRVTLRQSEQPPAIQLKMPFTEGQGSEAEIGSREMPTIEGAVSDIESRNGSCRGPIGATVGNRCRYTCAAGVPATMNFVVQLAVSALSSSVSSCVSSTCRPSNADSMADCVCRYVPCGTAGGGSAGGGGGGGYGSSGGSVSLGLGQCCNCRPLSACETTSCDEPRGVCVHRQILCDQDLPSCISAHCDPSRGCVYENTCPYIDACHTPLCLSDGSCVQQPVVCPPVEPPNNQCAVSYCRLGIGCVREAIRDGEFCHTTTSCNDENGNPLPCPCSSGCICVPGYGCFPDITRAQGCCLNGNCLPGLCALANDGSSVIQLLGH